jgi:parallel beta-helix repeat protein
MKNMLLVLLGVCLLLVIPGPSFAAEGRIPISEKTTITEPGSYIVTNDFTADTGAAITIGTSNVTIDLDGHTLTGSIEEDVIRNTNNSTNIRLLNGRIVARAGRYHVFLQQTTGAGGKLTMEDMLLASGGEGVYIQGGLLGPDRARAVLRRNTVVQAGDYAIALHYLDNSLIEENDIRGSTYSAIYLDEVTNSVVKGNMIVDAGGSTGSGIFLLDSINNQIVDNTVKGSASNGMSLLRATGNVIRGNGISNNDGSGIVLRGSSYNTVAHNSITSNLNHGIDIHGDSGSGSDYNAIDYNMVSQNGDTDTECGILFGSNASNNVYSYNRTLDNGLTCAGCGICNTAGQVSGGGNIELD